MRLLVKLAMCFLIGFPQDSIAKPSLSIITSIFKGDVFIKNFMENIVKIDHFDEFELLLINANSPGNEEEVIKPYLEKYKNIQYERLESDPGLYGVWNYAIKKASADYITNANVDDSRNPETDIKAVEFLANHHHVDLVYYDYYTTKLPNQPFTHSNAYIRAIMQEATPRMLYLCLPGPGPVWRKDMHERYGYFREDFESSADHEMWNRAISRGACLKKLHGFGILYYDNPISISNSTEREQKRKQEGAFCIGAYKAMWDGVETGSKLLIKIPTRSRPEKFFKMLDVYYKNLSGKYRYEFLISCDIDDALMNNAKIRERFKQYPFLTVHYRSNMTKVQAFNEGIGDFEFDVLLAASDDMEPMVKGYDAIIIEKLQKEFPDFDGILNLNDGSAGINCNSIPVLGKNYYKRFGYVYQPEYQSLYCQLELPLVSRILAKECIVNEIVFQHKHPAWGFGEWDESYIKNHQCKKEDEAIFHARRFKHFDLDERELFKKDWSILICTLEERRELCGKLLKSLTSQIAQLGLQDRIEILVYEDNRERSIGYKRNALLKKSAGRYVCFVDDDDELHLEYVKIIYEKIVENADCLSLRGIMTTRGEYPELFEHSISFNGRYCYAYGKYIRPPNHWNPIKKIIASQFLFPEVNFGEDKDWAMQIVESGLLRTEAVVQRPYYFYLYDGKYN